MCVCVQMCDDEGLCWDGGRLIVLLPESEVTSWQQSRGSQTPETLLKDSDSAAPSFRTLQSQQSVRTQTSLGQEALLEQHREPLHHSPPSKAPRLTATEAAELVGAQTLVCRLPTSLNWLRSRSREPNGNLNESSCFNPDVLPKAEYSSNIAEESCSNVGRSFSKQLKEVNLSSSDLPPLLVRSWV